MGDASYPVCRAQNTKRKKDMITWLINFFRFLTYRPAEPREVISCHVKDGQVDKIYDPKEYEAAK
jgi:hypothetical protein